MVIKTDKIVLPNLDSDDEDSKPLRKTAPLPKKPPSRDIIVHKEHNNAEPIKRGDKDEVVHTDQCNTSHLQSKADEPEEYVPSTGDEPLFERDYPQLGAAVRAFGLSPIQKLYSKKWEDRKAAIETIKQKMKAANGNAEELLSAVALVLPKMLRDKIYQVSHVVTYNVTPTQVYAAGIDLLNYVVGAYTKQHNIGKHTATQIPHKTYSILINRTGDTMNVSVHMLVL